MPALALVLMDLNLIPDYLSACWIYILVLSKSLVTAFSILEMDLLCRDILRLVFGVNLDIAGVKPWGIVLACICMERGA